MNNESDSCVFSKVVICLEECIELLLEVWTHIPESERIIICDHLGILAFANFTEYLADQQKKPGTIQDEGGAILELEGKCLVRIDMSGPPEVIKNRIAHELAHVLYDHPIIHADNSKAEEEAKIKAREWGFELISL
jgi:hypothetical protein